MGAKLLFRKTSYTRTMKDFQMKVNFHSLKPRSHRFIMISAIKVHNNMKYNSSPERANGERSMKVNFKSDGRRRLLLTDAFWWHRKCEF